MTGTAVEPNTCLTIVVPSPKPDPAAHWLALSKSKKKRGRTEFRHDLAKTLVRPRFMPGSGLARIIVRDISSDPLPSAKISS
jgi:hypothetical protein